MTRDPRAEWYDAKPAVWDPRLIGANDRLAALRPQLEAADALVHAVIRGDDAAIDAALAFVAARDAHLEENP